MDEKQKEKFKLVDYNNKTDFTNIELTFKQAILAKCWDCCCYDGKEVKKCDIKHCPLNKFKNKWFKIPRKVNENDKRKKKIDLV